MASRRRRSGCGTCRGAGERSAVHTHRANNRRLRPQRGRGPQASCLPCVSGPMAAGVPARPREVVNFSRIPSNPDGAGETPAVHTQRANDRRCRSQRVRGHRSRSRTRPLVLVLVLVLAPPRSRTRTRTRTPLTRTRTRTPRRHADPPRDAGRAGRPRSTPNARTAPGSVHTQRANSSWVDPPQRANALRRRPTPAHHGLRLSTRTPSTTSHAACRCRRSAGVPP